MKAVLVSLVFTLFLSCDYFEKKKITSEEILEEELQSFNWHDVDQYPTFKSCESETEKQAQRQCFESTLQNVITTYLSQQIIVVDQDINDAIKITIDIDKAGQLSIKTIDMKPETRNQIPQLDSLLHNSLDSVPKIFPAIKRSQHVSTQFMLPIEINIR